MNTRAEKGFSQHAPAGSVEIAKHVWWPLAELVLVLPQRMAHAVRGAHRPGATQPGRDGIDVPRMSDEWLRQARVDCDKGGDVP
jgi:hypothetical protein